MNCRATIKGMALLSAIESGLVKANDSGNYCIDEFEAFWRLFSQNIEKAALMLEHQNGGAVQAAK